MAEKPKLIYYEVLDFQKSTLEYVSEYFSVTSLLKPNHDTSKALEDAEVLFAPMGFFWGKNRMDRCPNLKVIGTPTTGLGHIDVGYAKEKNVSICSLRDQQAFLSTITATAELTWGLILSVTRGVPWAHESVCEGNWNGREFGKRTPRMLSDMTLGVIGLGRLGSWVARYGKAFRMKVLYYDPYVTDDEYIKCDALHELAKASDIVSIHVHLSDETKNLIDRRLIESMPEGSYIVNTARGGIVNEAALLEGLNSGHVAGAGLDMLAGEHLPGFEAKLTDHPLIRYARAHENLIITPKIGGATVDAWEKTERHVVDLIIEDLKKRGEL